MIPVPYKFLIKTKVWPKFWRWRLSAMWDLRDLGAGWLLILVVLGHLEIVSLRHFSDWWMEADATG